MANKVEITRKQAEDLFNPIGAGYGEDPYWSKGEHIAYNKGLYGWNWDIIKYRGKFYVAGYRNYPKTQYNTWDKKTAKKKKR